MDVTLCVLVDGGKSAAEFERLVVDRSSKPASA